MSVIDEFLKANRELAEARKEHAAAVEHQRQGRETNTLIIKCTVIAYASAAVCGGLWLWWTS